MQFGLGGRKDLVPIVAPDLRGIRDLTARVKLDVIHVNPKVIHRAKLSPETIAFKERTEALTNPKTLMECTLRKQSYFSYFFGTFLYGT